ncbi:EAL domain-containing protein [Lysobacter sp. TY2-98]|uniref:bifunctional diguanylate cyclase/phosphodiesterase n=1 Tax=Lysobacter sp. TY2-98 TaxID=2290922 RepID=UPI0013B45316|nr:EAL domain-containing protein [Lysobacter sp. TY2-98]
MPGPAATSSFGSRDTAWIAATLLGTVVLAHAVVALSWVHETQVPAVRLASAWLAGMLLLRRPTPRVAIGVIVACAAVLGALVMWAAPPARLPIVLGHSVLRIAEAALTYIAVVAVGCDPRGLRRLSDLAWLGAIAVVAAPSMTGLVAVAVLQSSVHADPFSVWRDWALGGAFGMLTLLPAVLASTPGEWRRFRQPGSLVLFGVLAALCIAGVVIASLWMRQPLIVLLLPLLVASLRLGVLGTALLDLLAVLTLLAVHRWMPGARVSALHELGFGELAGYAAFGLIAPLLVSVQTERRRATARELRDAAHQLRVLHDHVPAAIGLIDADGRYRLINRRYAEFLAHEPEEVIGRMQRDILGADYEKSVEDPVARAMAGERATFETRVNGRDLEVHYVPNFTERGRNGFFVLATDVSARIAAEHALQEEKERIRVTLDSIGDAVITCDPQLRITLLNPVGEAMTGWTETDAVGRVIDEVVRLVDADGDDDVVSPMHTALTDDRIVSTQRDRALVRRDGLRFAVEDSSAPIHDSEGRVIGGVMVLHDISETRAMAVRMAHQAQHDHLTDLPNRVLMQDRLEHAVAAIPQGGRGALMFVDLDHFKTINDSLGHQVGDVVLQEVAHRLQSTVRPGDTVSRQGGDEFVVLLERLDDPQVAARAAERMIDAMRPPIDVEGHRLHVSLSIGIALYPQDANDRRSLMRHADAALYHAKHAGRARYSFFARSMSERAERRLRMEHELRDALAHGGLFLVYQPKVQRPSGAIIGMEALVRWRRADGSLVPPMEFIPIAEESSLVNDVDRWVMREACRQASAWRDGGQLPGPVSVNVSLARFDADRLLRTVGEALGDAGLPGPLLEIEFTESQMFADHERAERLITGLHAMGVRIAIDDFGTGYSSLGYLANHRFDTIKIDRSFVSGLPGDAKQGAVVQAIIAMASALEAHVVAEGVETHAQASMLDAHGCREVQGYLYSRPLEVGDFEVLLERGVVMQTDAA